MPENEFEKKVSSEMQELRFKPSETVWIKVEERIRKKQRRRVFIIFFLLAGIALLGYWQWDNYFGDSHTGIVNIEKGNKIETRDKAGNDATKTEVGKNIISNKDDQNGPEENKPGNKTKQGQSFNDNKGEKKDITPAASSTNKTGNNISKRDLSNNKRPATPVNDRTRNSIDDKRRPNQEKAVKVPGDGSAILSTGDPVKADTLKTRNATGDIVNPDMNRNVDPTNKIDSAIIDTVVTKAGIKKDTVVKKMDSLLKTDAVDSPIVNIPKRPFDKKWKFGIEFIPGISSFHEDFLFLSLNMNKSADAYANPGGSGSGNAAPSGPVKSQPGFAFQFGGFFKKQFSPRSGLSLGLRWAYYSENFRIGARMYPAASSPAFLQLLDALGVSSAYDAGGVNVYVINEYHFIELPVNYNLRLNKNEAHPLNLQAGIKLGQMFKSNALVYDTAAGGIYYDSKRYFNKTQFGISASLNWKITKKDRFYLATGPVLDMHLNSLLDNPFDKKKYLLFAGLRTSVIFNSKK